MRERYKRRRVDWDEELRKTERIRRKGFFLSALSFAVAVAFIFGASRLKKSGLVFDSKVTSTLCLVLALFLIRSVLRRRERWRLERQEAEEELALRRMLDSTRKNDNQ